MTSRKFDRWNRREPERHCFPFLVRHFCASLPFARKAKYTDTCGKASVIGTSCLRLEEKWDFPHRLGRIGSDAGSPTGGRRTHEFRKISVKWLWSEKPKRCPNSAIPSSLVLSKDLACSIRRR